MVSGTTKLAVVLAAALTMLTPGAMSSPHPPSAAAITPPTVVLEQGSRTTVAEVYTGTWCYFCYFSGEALRVLEPQYSRDKLAIIEWHYSDAYEPVDGSITDRMNVYGIMAFPTLVVDGDTANKYEGGSDNATMITEYKTMFNAGIAKPSPVDLGQTVSVSGTSVSVSVTANPTGALKSKNVDLVVVVVENLEKFEAGHWIGWVARAMPLKKTVDLSTPQTASATATLQASWDQSKTAIVSYVQDGGDKSIYQGRWTALGGGGGNSSDTKAPQITSVSHSPASPTDLDMVTVSASIVDNVMVKTADLSYDDGSGAKTAPMAASGSSYSAKIGPFGASKTVTYKVEATDPAGNKAASTPGSFVVSASGQKDTSPPVVGAPVADPASPDETQMVSVTSVITDNVAVASASVEYAVDGGAPQTLAMGSVGSAYTAVIGPFPAGAKVSAIVSAKDTSGNSGSSPALELVVRSSPPKTDLALKAGAISVSESSPVVGQTLTVVVKVRNDGPGDATEVAVRLYAGGSRVGDTTIPAIASGADETAVIQWKPASPGKHVLMAIADPDSKQRDPDRGDNKALLSVDVIPKHSSGGGAGAPASGLDPGTLYLMIGLALAGVAAMVGGGWWASRRSRERQRQEQFFDEGHARAWPPRGDQGWR